MLLLGSDLSKWPLEKRTQALQMCVHCADIANPAKPLRFSLQWTDRVQTEFYSQVPCSLVAGLADELRPSSWSCRFVILAWREHDSTTACR